MYNLQFLVFLCEINQGANHESVESAEFRPIRDKMEAAKLYLKNTPCRQRN